MKIIRSEYIYIIPQNDFEKSFVYSLLSKRLIHENPKFKMKSNKRYYSKEPKQIQTFAETRIKDKFGYKISRGNYEIIEELKQNIPNIEFEDKRASYKIQCNSLIGPRDDEQKKAIKTLSENKFEYGILNSPPASGKTYIASQLITIFKERTLILVDMNLLIEQFIDSLLQFTDIKIEEIGLIREKDLEYDLDKKVIIATMQTLIKKKEIMKKLNNNIGFLIQDECQIASCDTIRSIFKELRPKYQLGLSGTPFRDDKMDFLIREMIGPIIYTTNKEEMIKKGSLIKPILRLEEGVIEGYDKVRGSKENKALIRLADVVAKKIDPSKKLYASFGYNDRRESSEQLKTLLQERGIETDEASWQEIGSVVSCHIGLGAVGIAFFQLDEEG